MIMVDSSVWIDYLRGTATAEVRHLDRLLGAEPLAIGDLILMEVLQGFSSDREFSRVQALLAPFELIELGGRDIAIQAAKNFRVLRKHGITIRKTIDTIIATRCIKDDLQLLSSDRDFVPFVKHLGLRLVTAPA